MFRPRRAEGGPAQTTQTLYPKHRCGCNFHRILHGWHSAQGASERNGVQEVLSKAIQRRGTVEDVYRAAIKILVILHETGAVGMPPNMRERVSLGSLPQTRNWTQ